jgi:hypothetical protein
MTLNKLQEAQHMKYAKQIKSLWKLSALFLIIAIACTGCGYEDDGVVDPDLYYMRYRYSEYDQNAPFFQWWYYTIKDYDTNTEFAFGVSQSIGPQYPSNDGTYIMFSMVETSSNTKFHKYEQWDLADMEVLNNGAPSFKIRIPVGTNPDFQIDFMGNDTYHLTGSMIDPLKVWFTDGTIEGAPVDPGVVVKWDLMIYRIYGWYGQQDLEDELREGNISWNTYAHTSEVEGTITVDGVTYTFERTPRYRAYCDMNWGQDFPSGWPNEDPVDYPWGWYYVNLPDADPNNDIGIIAGIGRQHFDASQGISEGRFADIREPGGQHIGVRQGITDKITPDCPGIEVLGTASDGDLIRFRIDRSDWQTYTDGVGSAEIPYRQIVTIVTTTRRVTMDFQSEAANYNRLLFPHQDYIFSDFEGLGVTCHVTIEERRTLLGVPFFTTLYDFATDDAGLEYGYDTSATNNPGIFDDDTDDTICTGAPEIPNDGIDQDCDGSDFTPPPATCFISTLW